MSLVNGRSVCACVLVYSSGASCASLTTQVIVPHTVKNLEPSLHIRPRIPIAINIKKHTVKSPARQSKKAFRGTRNMHITREYTGFEFPNDQQN